MRGSENEGENWSVSVKLMDALHYDGRIGERRDERAMTVYWLERRWKAEER